MQEVVFNPNESINVKQDTVVILKSALQNDIKEHNCNFCPHNYAVFEITCFWLHPILITVSAIPLSSTFFNPELMYVPGELDKFLVGLATQPRQKMDNVVSEQLTNHLFQGEQKEIKMRLREIISGKVNDFGMDLVALNIQRGRDHGLPGE